MEQAFEYRNQYNLSIKICLGAICVTALPITDMFSDSRKSFHAVFLLFFIRPNVFNIKVKGDFRVQAGAAKRSCSPAVGNENKEKTSIKDTGYS